MVQTAAGADLGAVAEQIAVPMETVVSAALAPVEPAAAALQTEGTEQLLPVSVTCSSHFLSYSSR